MKSFRILFVDIIDDRDELDWAYESGELSKEQYDQAIQEGDSIVADLCIDVEETQRWCERILEQVQKEIPIGR